MAETGDQGQTPAERIRLAEEARRESEAFAQAILASLSNHIAVLDLRGEIVAVNPAWEQFARDNGDPGLEHTGPGVNYLDVCRRAAAAGEPQAGAALRGIEEVLGGASPEFSMEYPCHSNGQKRWFLLTATPLRTARGGAVIAHVAITERKRMEEVLRESEVLYRTLVETMPDSVSVIDAEGVIVTCNRQAVRLCGVAGPGDLIGRSGFDFVAPEDRPRAADSLRQIRETGEVPTREYTLVRADGARVPVELNAAVVGDAQGRPRGFICVSRDVTLRKQMERGLRDSRERLEMALRAARMVAWSADSAGNVSATENAAEILGAAPAARVGDLLAAAHPEDRAAYEAAVDRALREGGPYNFSYRVVRPDTGAVVWLEEWGEVTKEAGGGLSHIVGIAVDVTARRRMEETLRRSEGRLRAIVGTAADAIVTIDQGGTVESFNPAAERMFGYAAAEVTGANVRVLMPSPYREEHDGYLERYLRTGEARLIGQRREVVGRRRDGTTFPAELAVSELPAGGRDRGGGRLFTGIIRDVSERKALQQRVLEVAAEEQRRIGQDLHDGVAQELAALGMLAHTMQVLADRQGLPDAAALAGRITARLQSVLEQVRSLSRGLIPVEVDAEGLMTALDDLARRVGEASGVACRFECPRPVLLGDNEAATHLFRIAQEALSNALRHGRPANVAVRLLGGADRIVLEVADDGRGLDRAAPRGTGMGLRTMEYRAQLMGATFRVESPPGGGTTVTCTLRKEAGT